MEDNVPEHVTSRSLKRGLNRIENKVEQLYTLPRTEKFELEDEPTPPASRIVVGVVLTAFVVGWTVGFFTTPSPPKEVIYVPRLIPIPIPAPAPKLPRKLEAGI